MSARRSEPLLHLVPAAAYDPEGGPYAPDRFAREGIIACATVDQAAGAARLLFAGTEKLLLLVIDPRLLGDVAITFVDAYGIGQEFPQLDGPIPRAAIIDVLPFPPGPGGRWARPVVAPLAES